jgi:hypothetical protein
VRNRLPLFALLFALAAFAAGLAKLFLLRFESGDAYPPCSSLRADPLGARAYREALSLRGGARVEPGFGPLEKLADASPSTVFVLGVGADELLRMPASRAAELEAIARAGGRLVLTLLPLQDPREFKELRSRGKEDEEAKEAKPADPGPGEEGEGKGERAAPPAEGENPMPSPPLVEPAPGEGAKPRKKGGEPKGWAPVGERWGFELAADPLPQGKEDAPPAGRAGAPGSGLSVSWHSCLVFAKLRPEWRVVLARGEHPVLIERDLGRGTLVLSSDSWLVTNEALRRERRAGLLAWLAGPHPNVVFDETHLGVRESPGVASLVRKYRLHGGVLGLLALAALFLWQNLCRLVPPSAAAGGEGRAAGRDHEAGLVALLRRNLPPAEISRVCLEEWGRASPEARGVPRAAVENARVLVAREQALPPSRRNPLETYHRISQTLAERK